jgi:hypothetical protein
VKNNLILKQGLVDKRKVSQWILQGAIVL